MSAPPKTGAPATSSRLNDPNYDPREVWAPSARSATQRTAAWGFSALFLFIVPFAVDALKVRVFVHEAVVFALVALSMNLLMGYTGQVSLGHGAFVGMGAFGFALAVFDPITSGGMPLPIAMAVGTILGALLALGLGAIALRVAGLYFALVTIVFGVFARAVLFQLDFISGGGGGASVVRPEFLKSDITLAYFMYVVLIVVWLLDWRLTSTKAGRAIQALRDDERVAASWGINVTAFKLLAFGLSGAIAGLAGTLLAMSSEIVSGETYVFTLSLTFVLMTVFGGLGSRAGVVIGGVLYKVLPGALDSANNSDTWKAMDGWFQTPDIVGDAWYHSLLDGTVGNLPLPGPQLTQLIIGLGIAAGGALLIRGAISKEGPATGKIGPMIGGGLAALIGLALSWGASFHTPSAVGAGDGGVVLWEELTGGFFTVIGAVLVLITLVAYPGGLAQLLAKPIQWLSYKKVDSSETVTVGGGAAGGGMGARP